MGAAGCAGERWPPTLGPADGAAMTVLLAYGATRKRSAGYDGPAESRSARSTRARSTMREAGAQLILLSRLRMEPPLRATGRPDWGAEETRVKWE